MHYTTWYFQDIHWNIYRRVPARGDITLSHEHSTMSFGLHWCDYKAWTDWSQTQVQDQHS
jgi:hypothetical protein